MLADEAVTNRRGIWEYVLGGETDTRLLEIRVFDRKTARAAYDAQTTAAKAKGESNCPLCATGHNANAKRLYTFEEMQADHVTAWSKGGATAATNCQMLCKTHNAAKGNGSAPQHRIYCKDFGKIAEIARFSEVVARRYPQGIRGIRAIRERPSH